MPRVRTGSLERRPNRPGGIYHARLFIKDPETGIVSRPWYCLNTTNEATAKAMLAELNEHPPVPTPVAKPLKVHRWRAYADAWLQERIRSGVAQAPSERGWLENHINVVIEAELGDPPIGDVRPVHVRAVLKACKAKGLKRETLTKIRGVMKRIFAAAIDDEIIRENPVDRAKVPMMREVQKERMILTDEEIETYLACPTVDEELQLISLVARAEGGMRTRDVNSWDWSMLDKPLFGSCFVPRTKTGKPQRLEIPAGLATRLLRRWERAGRPESGPVFPVRKGKRKGEFKRSTGVSYAKALRRDLLRAGITRHELHHETEATLPVDFHSFRRAFSTALADAGVNEQTAMRLAGHEDPRAHKRYVKNTKAMRKIPAAALPPSALGIATELPRPNTEPKETAETSERDTGFEPATLSLGMQIYSRDANDLDNLEKQAPVFAPRRSAVRRGELPPIATAANDAEPAQALRLYTSAIAIRMASLPFAALEEAELEEPDHARAVRDRRGGVVSEQTDDLPFWPVGRGGSR